MYKIIIIRKNYKRNENEESADAQRKKNLQQNRKK